MSLRARALGAAVVAAVAAELAAGCEPRSGLIFAERPPNVPPGGSWVVALLGGPEPTLIAQDLDDPAPLRVKPLDEAVTTLEAMVFPKSLASLGLRADLLGPREPQETDRPLPATRGLYRRSLGADAWTPISELDPQLAALRVPVSNACARVVARVVRLPKLTTIDWGYALDDNRVLAGSSGPEAWFLHRDGSVSPLRLPIPRGFEIGSAFRDARGDLWLGGRHGRIARLTWSGLGFSAGPPEDPIDRDEFIHWVVGPLNSPGEDLWVMTSSGTVLQRTSQVWAERHHFDPSPGDQDNGGLLYLGRGEVLVGYPSDGSILTVRQASVTRANPFTDNAGIVLLARAGEEGIVASQFAGVVATSPDGRTWRELGRSMSQVNLTAVAPLPGGFLYGTLYGYIGQYFASSGFCPIDDSAVRAGDITTVVPVGSSFVLLGSPRSVATDNNAVWVDLVD